MFETDPAQSAGCRQLAYAVIAQAHADMTYVGPYHSLGPKGGLEIDDRFGARAEAIHFLTADTGEYALARADWCDAADVCPKRLRRRSVAALNAVLPSQAPHIAAMHAEMARQRAIHDAKIAAREARAIREAEERAARKAEREAKWAAKRERKAAEKAAKQAAREQRKAAREAEKIAEAARRKAARAARKETR